MCCTENPSIIAASATLTKSLIVIDVIIFPRECNVNREAHHSRVESTTRSVASGFERQFVLQLLQTTPVLEVRNASKKGLSQY